MKKLIQVTLVLVLLFSLSACGNNDYKNEFSIAEDFIEVCENNGYEIYVDDSAFDYGYEEFNAFDKSKVTSIRTVCASKEDSDITFTVYRNERIADKWFREWSCFEKDKVTKEDNVKTYSKTTISGEEFVYVSTLGKCEVYAYVPAEYKDEIIKIASELNL